MKPLIRLTAIVTIIIISCSSCLFDRNEPSSPENPIVTIRNPAQNSSSIPELESGSADGEAEQIAIPISSEASHIGTMLVAKTKPIAIPVESAETQENKSYKPNSNKNAPFYHLYKNIENEMIVIEGTVKKNSEIPDPRKNDYPDCLYALLFEVNSVLSETSSTNSKVASEIILVVPIMKDKTIIPENKFLPGDILRCTCTSYDEMPQEIQEIQLSDDIQSFEHSKYYVLSADHINSFSSTASKSLAKREISIQPIQTLPKDIKEKESRQNRIQEEIARIEDEMKRHGNSFPAWKEEYKPIDEKYKDLCKKGWKGWINDSYFSAYGNETTYKTKEYIEAILPYKKYLEDLNIDLIIVRVPSKSDFAARVLASEEFEENPAWVEFYYECLKNDIEIVDCMPEMWENRFQYPMSYFYNIASDAHPLEGQIVVSGKKLSDVLKRYTYPTGGNFELEEMSYEYTNGLFTWPEGNTKTKPGHIIHFNIVKKDGKSIMPLGTKTSSPFIFVSNSLFGAYPFRENGCSVPALTAYYLRTVPDWFYQAGIGNAMLRNLISEKDVLNNRKVVIMIGDFRAWNGDFPKIPKYLLDKADCISLENAFDFMSPEIKIVENSNFFIKKEADMTVFEKNKSNEFSFSLTLPPVDNKNVCMLRFNFDANSYLTIDVYDTDDHSLIDSNTLTGGNNLHSDLFVPVSNQPRNVQVHFSITSPERKYAIKNVELWYY